MSNNSFHFLMANSAILSTMLVEITVPVMTLLRVKLNPTAQTKKQKHETTFNATSHKL